MYYELILKDKMLNSPGGIRNEREALTLCKLMDAVIDGWPLRALMIGIHRLYAIEDASRADGHGWSAASRFELIPSRNAGIVPERMREEASRELRTERRMSGSARGEPLRRPDLA